MPDSSSGPVSNGRLSVFELSTALAATVNEQAFECLPRMDFQVPVMNVPARVPPPVAFIVEDVSSNATKDAMKIVLAAFSGIVQIIRVVARHKTEGITRLSSVSNMR